MAQWNAHLFWFSNMVLITSLRSLTPITPPNDTAFPQERKNNRGSDIVTDHEVAKVGLQALGGRLGGTNHGQIVGTIPREQGFVPRTGSKDSDKGNGNEGVASWGDFVRSIREHPKLKPWNDTAFWYSFPLLGFAISGCRRLVVISSGKIISTCHPRRAPNGHGTSGRVGRTGAQHVKRCHVRVDSETSRVRSLQTRASRCQPRRKHGSWFSSPFTFPNNAHVSPVTCDVCTCDVCGIGPVTGSSDPPMGMA